PPVPTPVGPRPVPCKKPGPASGAAPGADIDDEMFIPARTLQKKISATRLLRPSLRNFIDLPLCDFCPHHHPLYVIQAARPAVLTLSLRRLPNSSSSLGCTQKSAISQESLDEEDDEAFEEEIQAEELHTQLTKGKKGKGKKSDVKGPFKSRPIPKEAKQRAFAIHANFEKQIQDLAAEISKAPQLLFSLVGEGPLLSHRAPTRWGAFEVWYGIHGEIKKSKHTHTDFQLASPQEWTKLVAAEHVKYCKDNLGDKWEDPEALNT
ncbi:hypothetical protein DXG01_014259, partial [Tephrocybe rancida]